jgi:hypothetical protein
METPSLTKNQTTFRDTLSRHYAILFIEKKDEYSYSSSRNTPDQLAAKAVTSLITGSGNKDGDGIKRTCKELNIPYTYAGIKAYLNA